MINAEEIILRMEAATGAETSEGLARSLGISSQAISSWKNRDSVPLEYLVRLALDMDVSLDWLVFGRAGERETRARTYEEATAKCIPFNRDETAKIAESLRIFADDLDGRRLEPRGVSRGSIDEITRQFLATEL